ncbi:hypothetical protein C1H46_020209 [Malus baccata]|uniref:Uncharacterized protein n=1 Tax=Malus baccata TaxID=106549 RepID=A0A540M5Z1_MALBA|nr:hypothetical protein C1H46_020209 [Malus baccata]
MEKKSSRNRLQRQHDPSNSTPLTSCQLADCNIQLQAPPGTQPQLKKSNNQMKESNYQKKEICKNPRGNTTGEGRHR